MRSIVLLQALFLARVLNAQFSVLTDRYDVFSQAVNTHEIKLNAKTVSVDRFGKLFSYYVDGAVYAQPLYVAGMVMGDGRQHDVVYVATMNDKVYAFDASKASPPLWVRDFTNEAMGITPVPIIDITNSNDLNLVGNAGVEGTPVIDLAIHSIFLVARTKENGQYVQRLHKMDLSSGKDQQSPVTIQARVTGSAKDAVDGFVNFDARAGNQRPALALTQGQVVIAWASHEDLRPYHGWIIAYDAKDLRQSGALCTTPDMADGGVWQSGRGPAIDQSGSLFFEVGNGGWDGKRNFGNSVIKVHAGEDGLQVEAFYTPHDYDHQNRTDADLGSTGPMLLPGKKILLCGNKQGQLFLLDPDHLGGLTPDDEGVLQKIDLHSGRVMAGPAYWSGPEGATIFLWNETGLPQEFRFDGRLLKSERIAAGKVASHASPGGALTVSADGSTPGSGILWATVGSGKSADHGNAPGVLYAFQAETLVDLWNSEQNVKRDRLGTLVKFVPPLVVDGRVYVPTYDNSVNVYGVIGTGEQN